MHEAKQWGRAAFAIRNESETPFQINATGRERWALECLIKSGGVGCSIIDAPAPRWSAYIFDLKSMGLKIDTLTERHGGPFSGHHARYVLISRVDRVSEGVQ